MREDWAAEVREEGLTPGATETDLAIIEGRRAPQPDRVADDALGDSVDIEALVREDFEEDVKNPNGSSIALLLECAGDAVLLAADAWPSVLVEGIRRVLRARGLERLPLAAFKVSHHGSDHNTRQELLELIDCKHFLISTNSGRFPTHPGLSAVARVITSQDQPTLHFNYRTKRNEVWDDAALCDSDEYPYSVVYPTEQGHVVWRSESGGR